MTTGGHPLLLQAGGDPPGLVVQLSPRNDLLAAADPARDAARMAELAPLEQAWRRESIQRAKLGGAVSAEMEQFGWLLEELRVSLFAQELRTPVPVSAKRLAKLWQSMRR